MLLAFKYELHTTYRPRVTITIFHWPPALSPNFYVFGGKGGQISSRPQVASLYTSPRTIRHCALFPPRKCLLGLYRWYLKFVPLYPQKRKNWDFKLAVNGKFAQTTHIDIAPELLHAGSCLGSSYIFHVSWKSVQGSRSCGGRKSPSSIDKAHILYNSMYYYTVQAVITDQNAIIPHRVLKWPINRRALCTVGLVQ